MKSLLGHSRTHFISGSAKFSAEFECRTNYDCRWDAISRCEARFDHALAERAVLDSDGTIWVWSYAPVPIFILTAHLVSYLWRVFVSHVT